MVKKVDATKKTKASKETKEPKISNVGKCVFCNETVDRDEIFAHLKKHIDEKNASASTGTKKKKAGKSYLIVVEEPYQGSPFFLALWIDGTTKLIDLDKFLREIWLDCCGHMSTFKDPQFKGGNFDNDVFFAGEKLLAAGKMEAYGQLMEKTGDVSMYRRADEAFDKYPVLGYEYDFGSTTELQITLKEKYSFPADKKLVLLSRNEPFDFACQKCGKAVATVVCSIHTYDNEGLLCESCAEKHAKKCEDFCEGAALPIVNSPRMGVCGYTGGTIDKDRDGVKESKWLDDSSEEDEIIAPVNVITRKDRKYAWVQK